MDDKIISRPTQTTKNKALFEVAPDWRDDWWGMPDFSMGDAMPTHRIVVNFMTPQDVEEFARVTGCSVKLSSDSMWYPPQKRLVGAEYFYNGPKTDSRYPICLPSKGRAKYQTTGKVLKRMGVSHRFFVEETEYDEYCEELGEDRVVKMPFHDLGKGSIPARNFIWEWALEREYKRHWVVDDNIKWFARCHNNRRLQVRGGAFFQAMEDFVDRYENIALAGPHHTGFVPDRAPGMTPFLLNSRVYSCILIDTKLKYRWRGRYNEDTDLSLRCLKDGLCTLLFRALLMQKGATHGTKGGGAMPGGNTDNVYNTGDHRLAFAQSLQKQHPDVVEVVWKFNRWHHSVDYSPFAKNKLVMRPGIVPRRDSNNYGMVLCRNELAKEEPEGE